MEGSKPGQARRRLDGEGRSWLATYQLARQDKAGWRIEGCVVLADSGGAST